MTVCSNQRPSSTDTLHSNMYDGVMREKQKRKKGSQCIE